MKTTLRILCLFIGFTGLLASQTYVGPEKCLQCHNNPGLGDMTGWRTSMHANGYSVVEDDSRSMQNLYGIIADYDQNGVDDFKDGLDFNTISSAFDPYKPNAPVLAYSDETGYTITIGDATHRVYLTYGGSGLYKQRYGVKINTSEGESADIYISPIQYNEKTHEYVLYHPDAWYDDNNNPKFSTASTLADAASNSRSLAKGCAGCHVTGLKVSQTEHGEWVAQGADIDPATLGMYADKNNVWDLNGDGNLEQINTGCETCHGPGGDHVNAPSKDNIINPADLTADQANNICGMCHSRGKSLPNNTFGYPYHDDTLTGWLPGDFVADIYTDGGGYWGDGVNSVKHHQQFYDFYQSSKPTFEFHQVRCFECHDVHNTVKHHIREQIVEEGADGGEVIIATDNDNNSLCLACHATHGPYASITKEMVADLDNNLETIAAVVPNHTHHSYDPTNENGTSGASRCSKCHNPKIAKSAVAYDIHSHTFEPISPKKTLMYGMPNSCAVSCHNKNGHTFGIDMSGDNFTDWTEETDKALAKKLLYWYENLWFDKMNADSNQVNAPMVDAAPTVDGDASDAAWQNVDFAEIPLANEKSISVKAVYTDTDIYMLLQWADSTASFTRSAWTYDGAAWSTVGGQSEDRIALLWNMTIPEDEFMEKGCLTKCHRDHDNTNEGQMEDESEDDVFLPAGQKADMWHMKAARSLPATSASGSDLVIDPASHQVIGGTVSMSGYIDDKYVGEYSVDNAPDGGRYGDAGSSTYARNRNADKTGPQYIETNPTDFMDAMVLTQAEVDAGEAVVVADLAGDALQAAWDKYAALNAAVPERVLRTPAESRGDIIQAATWKDGVWTTELKRALDTGHTDDDAPFAAGGSYRFGIAVIDNGGGGDHWTQGSALTTLNLLFPDGVASKEYAPDQFELAQNYPNPFNPVTSIRFDIAKAGPVKIKVYNSLGKEVQTLVDRNMQAGRYTVQFNGASQASGIYFYRIETETFTALKKMTLLK